MLCQRIVIAAFAMAAVGSAQQILGNPEVTFDTSVNRGIYNAQRIARNTAGATTHASKPDVVVLMGDTIVPHVVDGGGWKTTFKFVNLNNYPVTFKLLFFADNGTDLNLPILGVGTVINLMITLPVAGSIEADTAGMNSVLSQGWAYLLQQRPNDSIGGFAIFREHVPGAPDQEAGVPIVNQFDNHFALIYDNTGPFLTGVAIANASPVTSALIPVNIRDSSGNIVESEVISLAPCGHMAFVLPAMWPSTAGQQGVVEFLVSGLGVGALGLRFNGPAFTSFPILSNYSWIVP
jgi:hypothetical protein